MNIPFYKKFFSYLYPVTLWKGPGDTNPHLELLLYCNRLQLTTPEALYSDGDRYTPALTAINNLKDLLPSVKSVLALGGGLGSIVRIVCSKGYKPQFTLVEKDKVVLRLALELLEDQHADIIPIC